MKANEADVILYQAKKIVDLEQTVLLLTKENVRLVGANEHHHKMRDQQEGIINELRKTQLP